MDENFRWYVIQTKPGMEIAAHKLIKKLEGIEAFCPIHVRTIRHARREETVQRPLFPLYTFAAFDVARPHYAKILRTPGVMGMLGMRRVAIKPEERAALAHLSGADERIIPQPMRAGVVERLIRLSESYRGVIPLRGEAFDKLQQGTEVKILDGAFEGFVGLIDEDHNVRVKVLLDIFGRQTPISVSRESIAVRL